MQLPGLRMCGLKYETKSGKPLKREKSKSGQLRRQNSIVLDPEDGEYREPPEKREEKVGSSKGCGNAV